MNVTNATVAQALRRYASIMALQGVDRFRLKAYQRAAETIESLDQNISELVASGDDLMGLPGIGKAISSAIHEIVKTGSLSRMEKALAEVPEETLELSSRPRLDPKRVARIYKKLGIKSLKDLMSNLESGKIREIFGSRMEYHIKQGLDVRPRQLLWKVRDVADKVESFLSAMPTVTKVSSAGSLRRKQESVGDLNFLVSGRNAPAVFEGFSKFGAVQSIEPRTESRTDFCLSSGVTVSLQWTEEANWGVALIEATGSPLHVRELAELAGKEGVSLASGEEPQSKFVDENSVYAALGLQFIPAELREGRGELEAALRRKLPILIEAGDLRGDLHMHTTASDGVDSIEDMAKAARALGYQYISITDHSQSLKIANGLDEKRLRQQNERIDYINQGLERFRILKSAEVDILEDGSLDYSNAALKELDLTICSIHSRFALNKVQQTERVLRAMDSPYFNILGHATGRLLLSREGYELDIERIILHAKQNGCFFEINANPNRLDLSDDNAKLAKDMGVLIAVNTDAHSMEELRFIQAGVNQARRAWLTKKDVLNCYPLSKLLQLMKR